MGKKGSAAIRRNALRATSFKEDELEKLAGESYKDVETVAFQSLDRFVKGLDNVVTEERRGLINAYSTTLAKMYLLAKSEGRADDAEDYIKKARKDLVPYKYVGDNSSTDSRAGSLRFSNELSQEQENNLHEGLNDLLRKRAEKDAYVPPDIPRELFFENLQLRNSGDDRVRAYVGGAAVRRKDGSIYEVPVSDIIRQGGRVRANRAQNAVIAEAVIRKNLPGANSAAEFSKGVYNTLKGIPGLSTEMVERTTRKLHKAWNSDWKKAYSRGSIEFSKSISNIIEGARKEAEKDKKGSK